MLPLHCDTGSTARWFFYLVDIFGYWHDEPRATMASEPYDEVG